ncbi:uncharacterized protein ATNIH1004_004517 [Aspergillus tanneri]|uniref:Uncharacterized protein n=1 Tax=Aspergillus tanneri TaxID=1220188 RepID=A0A5M9MNL8_9EURO|nr:uncharacterized protein ATNIH1004_004517 [Aspergillus tanneri]KAA8648632.1 hypothetical protein ATNIH1004_004517 [Aspergillus tanneri]
MRVESDDAAEWQFLTAVYPLFKVSLPHIEGLPTTLQGVTAAEDTIICIRFDICLKYPRLAVIKSELESVALYEEGSIDAPGHHPPKGNTTFAASFQKVILDMHKPQ